MHPTRHLEDEHMRLYEWSGAGTGMQHILPTGSKRSSAWHASYGVLAVLTSLLILGGCDNKGPAGQVDQAAQAAKDGGMPGAESATGPGPQEAGAPAGEKPEPAAEEQKKP